MNNNIKIIYGNGIGKSAAAIGFGVKAADEGKQVIMVYFLKGNEKAFGEVVKRLEPEFKAFSFETVGKLYEELSEDEKADQKKNIMNTYNYAKKVIDVGECDVLILDELLGLVDYNLITCEDIKNLLSGVNENMKVIITGRNLPDTLKTLTRDINKIVPECDN